MSTWNLQDRADVEAYLSIGDGFNLLIDSTYLLQIQQDTPLTTWSLKSKN